MCENLRPLCFKNRVHSLKMSLKNSCERDLSYSHLSVLYQIIIFDNGIIINYVYNIQSK